MLYEYNGKIYIKPFSSKMIEVEIFKKGTEYDVKATSRKVELTPQIKEKITTIRLEDAYKKQNRNKMETI